MYVRTFRYIFHFEGRNDVRTNHETYVYFVAVGLLILDKVLAQLNVLASKYVLWAF